jgi:hypothetical protein
MSLLVYWANNGIVDFTRVPRVGGLDGFLVSFESRTVRSIRYSGRNRHIEVRDTIMRPTVERGDNYRVWIAPRCFQVRDSIINGFKPQFGQPNSGSDLPYG